MQERERESEKVTKGLKSRADKGIEKKKKGP